MKFLPLCLSIFFHIIALSVTGEIYKDRIKQGSAAPNLAPCRSLSEFIECFQVIEPAVSGGYQSGQHHNGFDEHDDPDSDVPYRTGKLTGSASSVLRVDFTAFERQFLLILLIADKNEVHDDSSVLNWSATVNIIGSNKNHSASLESLDSYGMFCRGHLEGQISRVYGRCYNDQFSGVIHTADETYFVEPAFDYTQAITDPQTGQFVVYRRRDILYESLNTTRLVQYPPSLTSHAEQILQSFPRTSYNWTRVNLITDQLHTGLVHQDLKLCEVHAVADHTFFTHIGSYDTSKVLSEMVYHLTAASDIFRHADFNGDSLGDNLGFKINKYTIYTDKQAEGYKYSNESMDVHTLLNVFSTENFEDSCVGVFFTYRDFDRGVLGLAWMASTSRYSKAGICAPRVNYSNPPKFPTNYYSFNSMLVSKLNFGKTVPRDILSVTIAHELGHLFGSPHDEMDNPVCSPGGAHGNYLMYKYSSSADRLNHWTFSPCSLEWMAAVVQEKGTCFQEYTGPHCGNGVLESGEQCDCGNPELCLATDHCCLPHLDAQLGCTFGDDAKKVCSPLLSPCCSATCEVVLAKHRTVCRPATECTKQSLCDGRDYECPDPVPVTDGTPCNNGAGICHNGECTSTVCNRYGMVGCQCTGAKVDLCKICCGCPGYVQDSCVAAHYIDILDDQGRIMYMSPGQTCNNYTGFCNAKRDCVISPRDSEVAHVSDHKSQTLEHRVKMVFSQYWYYIVLALAAAILLIGVIGISTNHHCTAQNVARQTAQQLVSVYTLAQNEQQKLEDLEKRLEDVCNKKLTYCEQEMYASDKAVIISRISTFFPSVPQSVILQAVHVSDTEINAVSYLINRGYTMRELIEVKESGSL